MSSLEIEEYSSAAQHTILGIPVFIGYEDGIYYIVDYEINMYGAGITMEEAKSDYRSVVREYYETLRDNESNLNANLRKHLYYLQLLGFWRN